METLALTFSVGVALAVIVKVNMDNVESEPENRRSYVALASGYGLLAGTLMGMLWS